MHLLQGGPKHASACCKCFPRHPLQIQRVRLDTVRYFDAVLGGDGARLTEDAIFPDRTEILGLGDGHCDSSSICCDLGECFYTVKREINKITLK